MRAVELVTDPGVRVRRDRGGGAVIKGAAERGLLLLKAGHYDNVIRILAPLNTPPDLVDEGSGDPRRGAHRRALTPVAVRASSVPMWRRHAVAAGVSRPKGTRDTEAAAALRSLTAEGGRWTRSRTAPTQRDPRWRRRRVWCVVAAAVGAGVAHDRQRSGQPAQLAASASALRLRRARAKLKRCR
jgi:hypothetical protein